LNTKLQKEQAASLNRARQ